jgi:hypothetical protein
VHEVQSNLVQHHTSSLATLTADEALPSDSSEVSLRLDSAKATKRWKSESHLRSRESRERSMRDSSRPSAFGRCLESRLAAPIDTRHRGKHAYITGAVTQMRAKAHQRQMTAAWVQSQGSAPT